MTRAYLIIASLLLVVGSGARQTYAQIQPSSRGARDKGQIDGIAARIEDDVITESEVRELGEFQQLVDGKSKSRMELLRELADQWLIRSEAVATQYAQPSAKDVDHAYDDFVKQFPSPEVFKQKCAAAGLSEAAVRRMIRQQLYLSRFIDYRFRPTAQVTDQQVADYYRDDFVPQLKARHAEVPPLDDVEDTIREVLIQRVINDRATKWLDDTRAHVTLDIVSQASAPQ
jgi:hypothetical protein